MLQVVGPYKYYIATFLINTENKKRLHVEFDPDFKNYEDQLEKYDIENKEKYQAYFSDRIRLLKENSDKYILNEEEKRILKEINNLYDLQFSLVFIDGTICITIKAIKYFFFQNKVELITEMMETAFEIIDRFAIK